MESGEECYNLCFAQSSLLTLPKYSSTEDGDGDEWVTEGVQLGGVASAMGVLGMWTGAQHEKMDPLGTVSLYLSCYSYLRSFTQAHSGNGKCVKFVEHLIRMS